MTFFRYMIRCARAYFEPHAGTPIGPSGVSYFTLTQNDIPYFTCLIGRGRDAWIITQLALEHELTRRGMETVRREPDN